MAPEEEVDLRFTVTTEVRGLAVGSVVEMLLGTDGRVYITGPDLVALHECPRPVSSFLRGETPTAKQLLDALDRVDFHGGVPNLERPDHSGGLLRGAAADPSTACVSCGRCPRCGSPAHPANCA